MKNLDEFISLQCYSTCADVAIFAISLLLLPIVLSIWDFLLRSKNRMIDRSKSYEYLGCSLANKVNIRLISQQPVAYSVLGNACKRNRPRLMNFPSIQDFLSSMYIYTHKYLQLF